MCVEHCQFYKIYWLQVCPWQNPFYMFSKPVLWNFLFTENTKVSKVHFTVVRSSSAIAKSSVQLLMFLSLTISELSKFFKLFFIYLPLMILHWIFFFWHTKLENQQWTLLFSVKVYLKVRQGDHCYVLHSYHFSTRNCRRIDSNHICHWS